MRNITFALSVATFCITAGSAAFGQESSGQAMGHNMATMNLPEQCQQAEGGQMPGMAGMECLAWTCRAGTRPSKQTCRR